MIQSSFGYTLPQTAHTKDTTAKTSNAQNLQVATSGVQRVVLYDETLSKLFGNNANEFTVHISEIAQKFLKAGTLETELLTSNGYITRDWGKISKASLEELQNDAVNNSSTLVDTENYVPGDESSKSKNISNQGTNAVTLPADGKNSSALKDNIGIDDYGLSWLFSEEGCSNCQDPRPAPAPTPGPTPAKPASILPAANKKPGQVVTKAIVASLRMGVLP
jgi:hypothetical protein